MKIPRIIHQTWKSPHVPEPLASYRAALVRLHPNYEHRLWTDDDNDAFVRREFPALYGLYRSFPREIYRADLARCLYLLRFGGVYLDLDIEPLRPFDDFLSASADCVLGAEPRAHALKRLGKPQMACNAFLASTPGHPFWEKMVEEIQRRSAQSNGEPVGVTGPIALDAAYESHGRALGVQVCEPDVLFPLPDVDAQSLPLSDRERLHFRRMRELRLYPRVTLGVHHWAHTWIPEAGFNRAVQRLTEAARGARSVASGQQTVDELLRAERYQLQFPEDAFPARARMRDRYRQRVERGYREAAGRTLTLVTMLHNRVDLALYLRARCESLLEPFGGGRVLVMYDDSSDGTKAVLDDWASAQPDRVVSVPAPPLSPELSAFGRMARLRNALCERLERESPTDFVAIMDGDLEGPVSHDGLSHALALLSEPDGPDGVAALGVNNWVGLPLQLPFVGYGYYDPLAFREHDWERRSSDAAIRLRLAGLRRGDEPLAVRSAFAGLALYRAASIRGLRYDESGRDCEHVSFHRALAERSARMVLDPSLILLAGRQGHHQTKPA